MKKPVFFYLLLGILFFSGCALRAKEDNLLERVNIAFQSWVGYGPFYLASEKGFFRDEGLELFFIDEQLDSGREDAFKQGMLDCEAGTIDLLVAKRSHDTSVVAVLELDRSFGSDGIVAIKDIQKIEDLRGKRVALARDDVGETFLSCLLHKKEIPMADIEIVPQNVDDAWKAFLDGNADAVVTWEPWLSRALERSDSHLLISTRDEPGIVIDTLNVREDIVKNNPKLVQKLIRAWFRAVKYYKENPIEASQIIAKYYNIAPEEYRKNIEGLAWVDFKSQVSTFGNKEMMDVFNTIAEVKFDNKRITAKPEAKKALENSLLKNAYENSP